MVKIPDPRLEKLAKHYKAEKTVPSAMTFVDIAGLVKGASKGEGLGNQFLGHIREVDVIMYVLRAFTGDSVSHVYERINPVDDLKIVRAELILKDIDTVERKLSELKAHAKSGMTDELELQIGCLEKVMAGLSDEQPAVNVKLSKEEREFLCELWLLTDKSAMYLLNIKGGVKESEFAEWVVSLKEAIPENESDFIIAVDCKTEGEVSVLAAGEKDELVGMMDNYHGAEDIVVLAFQRLNLITFYTGNEKETNAWTIQAGADAKSAAGVIHSDLEQSFVAAEVVNVEEMVEDGGWQAAKDVGKVKNVSRDYVVKDGDYLVVLASR